MKRPAALFRNILSAALVVTQSAALANPPSLNLASTQHTVLAGQLAGFQPASITVGGHQVTVNAGTLLTPAEATALLQIIGSGHQSLALSSQGSAIGGSFALTQQLAGQFSNVVVPHSVRTLDMYSSADNLSVNGDLTNSGNFYAISTNPAIRTVTLSAQDINNLGGGTITSIVPAAGLPGVSGAVANVNLILSAANNIVNRGTIGSSGALTLNAGGSITATGGGMSTDSDINMTTHGGNINLQGGNYLSQTLNLNAGTGSVDAQVGKITGQVNVDACNATVIANTKNLDIGTWNVTGDPVIANTGSIQLSGTNTTPTGGAPFVVVSGSDITESGAVTIDTTGANGGNVYLIAGAKFTPSPYNSSAPTLSNITITGPSSTGGSVNLPTLTAINTHSTSGTNGNGGNVEISAFAGSAAGSGTISLSPSSTIDTVAVGTGTPGHVFVIGGTSTNSGGTFGVSVGAINTNGGTGVGSSGLAGGHIVIATEQPNVSSKTPMVINPNNGQILQGGILGGAIANSPVNLAAEIQTAGGQVYVFSGIGVSSVPGIPGGTLISTASPAGVPGGMVTLIAGASGKLPGTSTINLNGGITTNADTITAGNVFIMAPASINVVGNISAQGTNTAGGGSVNILAGGNSAAIDLGNVQTGSSTAKNGGNVIIISASGDIGQSGATPVAINTSVSGTGSGNAGAVTVSSSGNISLGSVTATAFSGTGGSAFLSAGQAITVASAVNTSSTLGNAGGIYALQQGNSGPTIGSTTQTHGGAATPNLEVANYTPTASSIGPNSTTAFTITSGQPSAFAPGGYTSINDQGTTAKGGALLVMSVLNDPGVIVPIVSRSGTAPLTLLGSTTAASGIETDTHTASDGAGYILFSPAGIAVGSANAFLTSFNASATPVIPLVAASSGNVTLNNANAFGQQLTVGAAASSNGTLLVAAPGLNIVNALSAATPSKGASITLDTIGLTSLAITGNITAAGGISLMPTGQGNVTSNVSTNPYVIGGSFLTIGNSNLVGSIGSASSASLFIYADVNSLTVTTNPNVQTNVAAIGSVEDMNVSFNVGGAFQIAGTNSVILSASTAGQSAIILESDIQASSATAGVSSPQVGLAAVNAIGTASSPLLVSNLKTNTSPMVVDVTGGGSDFLKNADKQGIELGGALSGGTTTFNAVVTGSILLDGMTATNLTLKTGTAGGILANGIGNLTGTNLLVTTGSQGIGINGTGSNQIQLSGALSSVQIISAGGVRLFSNSSPTFSGASSAGASSTGFTVIAPNSGINFASTGSITAPSVFLDAAGAGNTITQTSTTLPSINAASTILVASGIGGAVSTPIIIKGGNLTAQSTGTVSGINIQSVGAVTLVGLSTGGAAAANLVSGGAITFASGATLTATGPVTIDAKTGAITQKDPALAPVIQSNTANITADTGSIGTTANPITLDTGFGSGAGSAVTASLNAPAGSITVDGLADPSSGHKVGMTIGSSVAKTQAVINSVSSITLNSASSTALTAGKSVAISSPLQVTDAGGNVDIATPSLILTTGTTAGGTVKISNVTGNATAPNLTVKAQSAFSLISTAGINFVGASTGESSLTITANTGNINITKGASINDINGTLSLTATTGNVAQAASATDITALNLILSGANAGTSSVPLGITSASPVGIGLDTHGCTANVFVAANGPVGVFGPSLTTLTGTYQLVTSGVANFGTITMAQTVSAQTVTLKTLNNASIDITSGTPGVLGATGTLTVSANGTGSIVSALTLLASNLVLTTGSGQIVGTPANSGHLLTQADTISANIVTGTTGSVDIRNTNNTGPATLLNSSAGGAFTFLDNGNFTVNSITTRSPLNLNNGNIFVQGMAGSASKIGIAPGAKITANGGTITVQSVDATGTIDIGKGAHISTLAQGSNGQIQFLVGTTASPQAYTGPAIPGLTINNKNNGLASLGSTATAVSINVVGTSNILNCFGQNIIFNTGAGNTKAITLEGGVVVTADPLSPVGAKAADSADDFIVDSGLDF